MGCLSGAGRDHSIEIGSRVYCGCKFALDDFGTASSLAAAVPVMLLQAKHSRDFEREVDA